MNATFFKTGQALPLPNTAVAAQPLCPSTVPLVLFPVRLETRFFPVAGGAAELRIRVYPEQIHIDSHQPELTTDERNWGAAYWRQDWAAADEQGRGDAWRILAARYGPPRAAWIARTLKPTNIAQRGAKPPVAPVFPTLPPVQPGGEDPWRTAPKARLLPDRWIAMAHAGGKLALTATGKPIRRPLAVGPDPKAPALDDKTDAAVRAGTALPIDPGMKWMVDYDEAELAGMALRMTVPPDLLASGLDSLVVFGVSAATAPADSAAQLADLLDAHAYTDGLSFMQFGAPTNNTEDERAGFSTDHAVSFRNEILVDPAKSPDAARLGRALGLPDARIAPTLGHLVGADGDHDLDLRSMATALWPVGWGYFLTSMVGAQTGFGAASLDWARSHFVANVRGGGPFPSLRVGRQPYGILPTTSLDLWAAGPSEGLGPQDTWLKGTLQALREQVWRKMLSHAPRIGLRSDSPDPDADLADLMLVDGVAHAYAARRALGGQYLRHLNAIQNLGMGMAMENQATVSNALLDVLALSKDPSKRPRLAGLFYEASTFPITAPLVQAAGAGPGDPLAPNYIADLLKPTPIATLAGAAHNGSLLEALLRHAFLREYATAAARVYATTGQDLLTLLKDSELVDLVDLPRDNFVLKNPPKETHWRKQLDLIVKPVTGTKTIRAWLEGLKVFTSPHVTSLGEFRGALDRLSHLDAQRLGLLMQSTLDLSSHRLDAWITSVATKRLTAMRNATSSGQIVGAYGWVENLHPADPATLVADASVPKGETAPLVRPAGESGFIHALSTTHAAAAALLRNAHLGPSGAPDGDDPFAIDLSSRRVREATRLLDGVRGGQPLGALLGYRLERRLHETGLSPLIAPLRAAAPLTVRDRGDGAVDPKLLAANNVVDGLALSRAYKPAPDAWLAHALPNTAQTDRDKAKVEIDAMLGDLDGLSDALTAETAYQLARGNSARLGATLAAVAQGAAPPPELEVARTPRTGVSLTHRVAVLFDDKLPAVAGWPGPATSPLAAANKLLNAWISRLLGDPRKVRCTVERLAPDGRTVAQTLTFPLSELQLTPLDVVYALDDAASPTGASPSHLEQLVLINARTRTGGFGAADGLRLQTARPTNLAAGEITFSDAFEQARAIRRLFEQARGLTPADLAPPERPTQGVLDVAGLLARVKAGEDALLAIHTRLNGRVKSAGATAADDLRSDLMALGEFGLRPAAPCEPVGDTPDIRLALARQGASLLAVSGPRLDRAATLRLAPAASDPRERCAQLIEYGKAVFGPRFVLAPQFTCDAAGAAELKSALAAGTQQQGGDPLAVHAWLLQSGQVREPVAALGRCLRGAEVLGASERLALGVAQLPFNAAERWVGLPPLPKTDLAPGKLSLAVQAVVAPNTTGVLAGLLVDEWVEVVPSATETTALTFQFNPPNAFAPQAVLLAVPPVPGQDWTTETLRQVLVETLDLAKLRAIDPSLLGAAAQYLPGVYLPFNAEGHAVSTDVAPLTL